MNATVTHAEALRRLVAAVKLIDYADCKDETVWQALGAAQGTAEGVLRDGEKQELPGMWEHADLSGGETDNPSVTLRDGLQKNPLDVFEDFAKLAVGSVALFNLEAGKELAAEYRKIREFLSAPVSAQPAVVAVPSKEIPTELLKALNKHCCENVAWIRHAWMEYVATAPQPAAVPSGDVASLPEKMSPHMREAMWDAIVRHGSANLEYWIEDLYNDIRAAALKE